MSAPLHQGQGRGGEGNTAARTTRCHIRTRSLINRLKISRRYP